MSVTYPINNPVSNFSADAEVSADVRWTHEQIDSVLRSVITKIQMEGGNAVPDFVPDLCIMQDIEQFDSLIAIEAVLEMTEHFGIEIPNEVFYNSETGEVFTYAKVIDRLFALLNPVEAKESQLE